MEWFVQEEDEAAVDTSSATRAERNRSVQKSFLSAHGSKVTFAGALYAADRVKLYGEHDGDFTFTLSSGQRLIEVSVFLFVVDMVA